MHSACDRMPRVRASLRRRATNRRPVGRLPDPGSDLPYRQIDHDDAWSYSPAHPYTYNVLQTAPYRWTSYGDNVEVLWRHGRQYRYAAVLDFNLPAAVHTAPSGIRYAETPVDTSRGGGIFLHVTDGTATAGCIAVPEATRPKQIEIKA